MKKLLSLLLVLCFLFSLAGCGDIADSSSAKNTQQIENSISETASSDPQPEQSDGDWGTFQKNASLAETVMVDEGGVKITAAGLNYTNYSAELELTIENNSGKDLSFSSGTMGYSCNSINGYMVEDGYLHCSVADGKKANESISFSYDGLMLYGIREIADMEIGFAMTDDEYNDTYTGPLQLKTSAFESHDYGKDHYQEAITSRAAMNAYDYDIPHFSQETLYDVNGVKLLSIGLMVNQDGDTACLLELENTTGDTVYVSASDIAINGLTVYSSIWSSSAINPGRRGIISVNLSSVLDSEHWDIYGIREVGSVSLSLSQRDSDGNVVADKTPVEIAVPGLKAEYDAGGDDVYNNGGLRIAAKTVLEDPSDYSAAMYVLLLAENKSGKTLTIDAVYDSISVNGFMTDVLCDSRELADGECAAIEIMLLESSLEANKITSVSDIEEIEFGLEIKEEGSRIDEPVIQIVWN